MRSALHSLARGLVRRSWLVALITIALCASFAAHAIAALDAPVPPAVPPGRALPRPARPAVTASDLSFDPSGFVARNIFCSSCKPAAPAAPEVLGRAAVLISTTAGKDPRATVRVPETFVQGNWGLGDRIPGLGAIARIGPTSIDLDDGTGKLRTLSILDARAAGPTTGAATPAPAPAPGPFASRIRKLGEGVYEVDRALVRELVSGTTKRGKTRMLPIVKNGDVKGVRVLGVRRKSVGAAIGLKNADIINAIDGAPIKNAQQLLDLYANLDRISVVELQGKRRGKPLAITLRLR